MLISKVSRRGSILIEPYKQLRFGLMFLLVNMIFSVLIFLGFSYYLWEIYEAVVTYFKLDPAESLVTLEKLAQPAFVGLALLAAFIGTTLVLSARYTHQIFGPLVSIRRFIDELLAGKNPAPIKLRASDQLQDLAARLNALAEIVAESRRAESSPSEKKPRQPE